MLEESKKAKEGGEKVKEGKEDQETNSKKNKTKKESKKLHICSTTYLNIYELLCCMLYIPLTWLAYSKEHYAGQNSCNIRAKIFKFFPIENENPFPDIKYMWLLEGAGWGDLWRKL